MSGIDIDWGLAGQQAQTTAAIPAQVAAGQQQGYDLGQEGAALSALKGVDMSDPASMRSTIGALTQAGAISQAKALSDLQLVTGARARLTSGQGAFSSLMGGGQSSAAAQPASGDPGAAPVASSATGAEAAPGQAPNQPLINKATSDLRTAASFTDPAQRQAHLDQVKSEFLQAGIDEAAIDRVIGDGSQDTLNAAADGLAHVAAVHPTFGGTPQPGLALPANAPDYVAKYLQNAPAVEMDRAMYKAAGIPVDDIGSIAKMYAGPEIQKQADLQSAGPIAAATEEGRLGAVNANTLQSYNLHGRPTELTPQQALLINKADPGAIAGLNPEEEAFQRSAGSQMADIQYGGQAAEAKALGAGAGNLIDVPITDPTTGVTRTAKMSVTDYVNGKRSGQLGAGVGVGPTDQQAVANKGDAEALTQTRQKVADPANVQSIQSRVDAGTKALALLQGIKTNDLTPHAQDFANVLNSIGVKAAAKDANNLALYSQATNNAVLGYTHDFPSRFTDKDLSLVHSVTPTLTTPTDAAKFAFATQVAAANRERSYAQAVTDYRGVSQRDLSNKFNNGQGAGSLFADPVWRSLQINGKPAVSITPKPYKDGHTYGVLFPGTPQQATFLVH